ncbi:hypothetical protein [Aminobacter niigataensis]|uniref:hypothetical protein n=1 Tax=Aminobacter niigataensis TaxID=83265 RepID=UPI0024CAE9B1|nr:hypothetical protein [Aminobacter niigataensis]CAI2935316.1 protein of unknown function [Aminobacter niigataensis]
MSMRTGFPDTIKFTSAMEELELAHAQHCSIAALARPFQQAISIASIAVEIFTKEQNSECPELPDAYLRFKWPHESPSVHEDGSRQDAATKGQSCPVGVCPREKSEKMPDE